VIPLSKPSITESEINAVVDVMKSGHIAQGKKVQEFERAVAKYNNKKYAIAVSSGTAGLFLSLKAMGVGYGQRVITTPFSFVASTNVIYQAGATPFYVDVDRDNYNLSISELVKKVPGQEGISAILPVDIFGNPFNTNRVHGLPVILDSCESLGEKIERPFDAAVYAFYPNKNITTGEGGMIVTNSKDIRDYCVAMRNQGRKETDAWLNSSYMGFNFRMTDIQAAIGIEQMKRIDELIQLRAKKYHTYLKCIELYNIEDAVRLQKWENGTTFAPFVFTVEVDNRDRIILYMKKNGIETKPYFPCIHLQPYMLKKGFTKGMFPIAEEISQRTIALPFYPDISDEEIIEVIKTLKEAIVKA
jgi:perosamine synthetase